MVSGNGGYHRDHRGIEEYREDFKTLIILVGNFAFTLFNSRFLTLARVWNYTCHLD
jgi:hypothetical protein